MIKNNAAGTVLISFGNPMFSIGVNTLSSVLKSRDLDVSTIYFVPRMKTFQIFEDFTDHDYEALVEKCRELDPAIIGLSVFSGFFHAAVRITEELKKVKDFMVVWGGIHPTLAPEESLEHADAVCVGEGEAAIAELVSNFHDSSQIEKIDNLWTVRNGNIIKNPVKLNHDLDAVPFPDMIGDNKYILAKGKIIPFKKKLSFYSLMTSRGCFFSCSYCSNQAIKNVYENYRVRRRSVENVMEELQSAVKGNPHITRLYFYDDVFTYDLKWMKEFSKRYKEEIGLPFFCYTHPNLVKDEIIKTVKDMGCNLISMGIQGSSNRMRKLYNRKTSDEDIRKACRIITKYKFDELYMDIIFSPFDTVEDKNEGLDFLLSLPKPFYIGAHSLTFYPMAEISKMAMKKGIISEKDMMLNLTESSHLGYRDRLFSSEGKWWFLYSLCGKRFIPNSIIRISKYIPGAPLLLFLLFKVLERIPLMINKRNVFTR